MRIAFALIALLASAPASALERCRVTDPTGTPLNVRDAEMYITGTLDNGRIVMIRRNGHDRHGKPWALVESPEGEAIGWVYREFISCF